MAKKKDENEKPKGNGFAHPGIENDILKKPIIFLADEANKKVKIPGLKLDAIVWLPLPPTANFKDYKYVCKSKCVAGVLRRKCSPHGIMETKAPKG